jgi:hypothetical protein
MSNNIHLIAFGTFGNPNGFKQSFFHGKPLKIKTFDLNTNAIKLFPNTHIYALRKEYFDGQTTVAYLKYSFAKEPNSDRSGTFIGSGVLYTNSIPEEKITVSILEDFQNSLVNNNVKNDVISVSKSDDFKCIKPSDFEKAKDNLKKIEILDELQNSNKSLVVYCETKPEKIQSFFKKGIELLAIYDTIYFTNSNEITEFVVQKKIYRLIQNVGTKKDFDFELQQLHDSRTQKINNLIQDFEKEKRQSEEIKNKKIKDFKSQIERNEKTHYENANAIAESKNELRKIENIYLDFINELKDFTQQLNSGSKLNRVEHQYRESKRRFNTKNQQIQQPKSLSTITQRATNDNQHNRDQSKTLNYENRQVSDINEKGYAHHLTVGLAILLLGTWTYLLFFDNEEEASNNVIVEQQSEIGTSSVNTETHLDLNLTPEPNSKLNENDVQMVISRLTPNMSIKEVVQVIFEMNPTDIESKYGQQKDQYIRELYLLNKSDFDISGHDTVYIFPNKIKHISSYSEKQ